MTRLAVLSDIHGILPALEAALAQIEPLGVDGYLVAGDMFTGPNPSEVYKRLSGMKCWMIRGNHENYLLRFHHGKAPGWWYTAKQWSFMHWAYQHLDPQALDFISTLPEQTTLHLEGTHSIRMVPGSPRDNNELVFPDKDPGILEQCLAFVSEPVLIFGHTHLSWLYQQDGRLALNPGSVSGNFSRPSTGGYAILEWSGTRWTATLHEVGYSPADLHAAFKDGGLLEAGGAVARYWMMSILSGVNVMPRFIEFAVEMSQRAGFKDSPFVPDEIWDEADQLFAAGLVMDGILPPAGLESFLER